MYVADASSQDFHVHRCRAAADICGAAVAGVCGAVRMADRQCAVIDGGARPHLGGAAAVGVRLNTAEFWIFTAVECYGCIADVGGQESCGKQGADGGTYPAGGPPTAMVVAESVSAG